MKKLLTTFIAVLTISTVCFAEELPDTESVQEVAATEQALPEQEDCILEDVFEEEFTEEAVSPDQEVEFTEEAVPHDPEVELVGIEEVNLESETIPITASVVEVSDVLENHDVFNFGTFLSESEYISMMASVLPGQVTVILSDGRQVMAPVTGAWKHNAADKCYENSAVVPEGVTDNGLLSHIRIRYTTNPYKLGALYFSGSKTEGNDTGFEFWMPDNEDTFFVYKADGAGISTLKCSSETSQVQKESRYVTLTEPKSSISDSGNYFVVSYNSAARDGNDCPIYLTAAFESLYVDHAWTHTLDGYLCKECGIYYEQVYDWSTGQRLEKQKTLEELKAEKEAERQKSIEECMKEAAEKSTKADTKTTTKASEKTTTKADAKTTTKTKNTGVGKVAWKSVKKKKKNAVLKWKKVKNASYYEVYWRVGKKGKFKKLKKTKSLSYTKKKLKKGKTYYFKVRAVRKVGKKKKYGKFSATKKIKI